MAGKCLPRAGWGIGAAFRKRIAGHADSSPKEVEQVMLLDMQGSVLKTWSGKADAFIVEDLRPGVYLVAVCLKDGRTRVLKLVAR